jgi:O-antigen/teichoic acid export membrane protein
MENIKKKIINGSLGQYFFLFVSTIVGLIKAPFGLNYFGQEIYGIWLVISSITSYLALSQFGIGPAIITLLSRNNNIESQKEIIVKSIKIILFIVVLLILFLSLIYFFIPEIITKFYNIEKENLKNIALVSTSLMILFSAIRLPSVIIKSSFSGLNNVVWNKIYGALGSFLSLISLFVTIYLKNGLIFLSLLTGVFYIIVGIISGIHLYKKFNHIFKTEIKTKKISKKYLLGTGSKFFIITIASTIIIQTDNIVISTILGPEHVTPYSLTFKVFYIMLSLINAFSAGLWPIYGNLASIKEYKKMNKIYNKFAFFMLFLGGLAWIGGINFSKYVIELWVGSSGYAGFLVVLSLGGFVFISSFTGGVNSPIINALNPTKAIVFMSFIEAISNLFLSIILIRIYGIGGVALATFISVLVFNSWFSTYYINKRTYKEISLKLKEIFYLYSSNICNSVCY